MRSPRRFVAVLVATLLALVVGIWLVGSPRLRAAKDKAQPVAERKDAPGAKGHDETGPIKLSPEQRQALGIKVEPIQPRILETQVDVTGKIAANPERTVVVAPRAQGRVVKVLVHLGDTVGAGATLALLDSPEATDLLGELAQAESALALASRRAPSATRSGTSSGCSGSRTRRSRRPGGWPASGPSSRWSRRSAPP